MNIYIKYIHILNHIWDLAWHKMKFALEQQYMLSVLHSQYHVCWCSGDCRSQGISKCVIDPQSQNIPYQASEEFILMCIDVTILIVMNTIIKWICSEMQVA